MPTPGGAGEHDSEFAGPIDRLAKEAIRAETEKKREEWPDASDHMDHFLDNSGEDYQVDVDRFLNDNPDLSDQAEVRRHTAGRDAVEKAKAEGVTGPVTYPLSTPWIGGAAETENWYYATGSYDYNQTGTVTVYPPDENNPTWRYEVETQVNFRDRYDWDPWKQTPVDERNIEDEQLGALHRAGIAQEYNLTGESSPQRTEGTA